MQVLQTSIQVMLPGTVVIRDSIPVGMLGAFSSSVKNVYTEVLQDTQRIRMDVEVWLKDQPTARATIHGTEIDLVNRWLLVRGSLLTLGIDTAALVQKQWSHRTDAGVPFWNYSNLWPAATVSGESYCQSESLRFVGRATVQVFKNVQPKRLPDFEFTQIYQVFGITCPPPIVVKK